jgi:hypothetical protein
MNGLNDDICDILVEAVFSTRLAQVYLAGNSITQVRTLNQLLGVAIALLWETKSGDVAFAHHMTVHSGWGSQSQVLVGALAPA